MLAVVGSGEYLAPMAAVDRQLIELFGAPPRVVCLPTAAGREGNEKIDDWMHRGVEHFRALGVEAEPVRVWDRTSANDPSLAERIASADFVYLSGGKPSYLHATLESSLAWQAITDVVVRGGLLAGCSAGRDGAGRPVRRFATATWRLRSVARRTDRAPLRRDPVAVVSASRLLVGKKLTLIGVNANTALVEVDGTYRVIGDQVTVWTATQKTDYGPGELPPDALLQVARSSDSTGQAGRAHEKPRLNPRRFIPPKTNRWYPLGAIRALDNARP